MNLNLYNLKLIIDLVLMNIMNFLNIYLSQIGQYANTEEESKIYRLEKELNKLSAFKM